MRNNPINDYQESIVAILAADPWLLEHAVTAVAENRLDVEAAIDTALASVGMVATVVTPDVEGIGTYQGAVIAEIPEMTVSVSESVAINRERPNACTALDAAVRMTQLLHADEQTFRAIRMAVEPERGLVIANVTFATSIQLTLTTPITPPPTED